MKTVLLTGCSSGIGRAILNQLLERGDYKVYGLARSASSIEVPSTGQAAFYDCDLEDTQQATQVLEKIVADSGGIDIIIQNAGTGAFGPIEELGLTEWNAVLAVNLTAQYLTLHHILPHMKQQDFGKIITTSSDADHLSFAGASAYCASKAGASILADCVRKEAAGHNITVTTIAPGRVDTNFNHKKKGDRPNSLAAEDVAAQVLFVLQQSPRCEIEKIYLNSVLEKELH